MKEGVYAVIFSSRLHGTPSDYDATAARMVELAMKQPGYVGHVSTRGPDGTGITVSYWESEEAIAAWKADAEHSEARRMGREKFYTWYRLDVAKVERSYDFNR